MNTCARIILFALLTLTSFAKADMSEYCSVRRQMIEKDGQSFYIVTARAHTLYMISRDLYGDEKSWHRIAQWNQMSAPYTLVTGQKLLIQEPPRLTEEEGNKILMTAWEKVGDIGISQKFSLFQPAQVASCTSSAEEPVPSAASEAIAAAKATATTTASIAATATAVTANVEAINTLAPPVPVAAPQKPSRWSFSAALTTSLFSLTRKDTASALNDKVYSKLNYGAELSAWLKPGEKSAFVVTTGVEQIQIKPASNALLARDQQTLGKFAANWDYSFNSSWGAALGYRYAQRPFYRPTSDGATIDAVYVPEAFLGGRWRVLESVKTATWLTGEGGYTFAVNDPHHDIKEGSGFSVGLQIEHELQNSTLLLQPGYRFSRDKGEADENEQESYLLSIGLLW